MHTSLIGFSTLLNFFASSWRMWFRIDIFCLGASWVEKESFFCPLTNSLAYLLSWLSSTCELVLNFSHMFVVCPPPQLVKVDGSWILIKSLGWNGLILIKFKVLWWNWILVKVFKTPWFFIPINMVRKIVNGRKCVDRVSSSLSLIKWFICAFNLLIDWVT